MRKIIYYYWGELISVSAQKAFEQNKADITLISPTRKTYDYDYEFMAAVKKTLLDDDGQPCFDTIFSFNYFPDLSRVAEDCGVQYVSWVYDSPHLTLQSVTLGNDCNRVYIFDYTLYMKYIGEGITTVGYMPLPARIMDCYNTGEEEYKHDITFVGSLYDKEQDQYGCIEYLPEYIVGYLDAVISTQQQIYGADLISRLVTDELCENISQYVNTNLGSNYRKCENEIFRDILRRRVTMNERIEILSRLGEKFGSDRVDLFCGTSHPELPVTDRGVADYNLEMPEIFASSKINLNISLKSIQSGIPLRVMDILGAGGFCITNYQPEIAEYFENGRDIVWYESIEDLVDKCCYYLEHEDERKSIAVNGQRKVKDMFEFSNQLAKVLNC